MRKAFLTMAGAAFGLAAGAAPTTSSAGCYGCLAENGNGYVDYYGAPYTVIYGYSGPLYYSSRSAYGYAYPPHYDAPRYYYPRYPFVNVHRSDRPVRVTNKVRRKVVR